MKKSFYSAIALVLLVSLGLSACRGGNDLTSSEPDTSVIDIVSNSDISSDGASSVQSSVSSNVPASSTQTPSTSSPKKLTISIADYEKGNTDYDALNMAIDDAKFMTSAAAVRGENIKYTLKLRNKKYTIDRTLELNGCSNFTIDGAGATIVMTTNDTALKLSECNNLTISNLSLDYDPLWFTQGTITAVDGNNLTLKIDAGYRDDFEKFLTKQYSVMRLHDPETGGHLAGATTDYEIKSVKRSSSGVLIATMSIPYTNVYENRTRVGKRF